jgi:hypothetical protein
VDWVSLALKPSQMAGKRDMKKTNRAPFSDLSPEFPPRESDGPVAIWTHPTGVILDNRIQFFNLLIFLDGYTYLFLFFFYQFPMLSDCF